MHDRAQFYKKGQATINFHRTACVKNGMMADALGNAREFVALMKKVAGVDARVELPIGGNPWRIRWTIQYADLNAMNVATMKLMANADYLALPGKTAEYLINGASMDEIWYVLWLHPENSCHRLRTADNPRQ